MSATTPFIMLDETNSSLPLYRQIYEAVRGSILSGEFASGKRLPASRLLAQQLGVSRMTVINAYDQLFAEGYLEGRTGSGTFVASQLPEEFLHTPKITGKEASAAPEKRAVQFSEYGSGLKGNLRTIRGNHCAVEIAPFQHSLTAPDEFPFDIWSKIAQRHLKYSYRTLSCYGEPAGYLPLRRAVAEHLRSARGVQCEDEQVIITTGAQQAKYMIARILLLPEDNVWVEDPDILGRSTFLRTAETRLSGSRWTKRVLI